MKGNKSIIKREKRNIANEYQDRLKSLTEDNGMDRICDPVGDLKQAIERRTKRLIEEICKADMQSLVELNCLSSKVEVQLKNVRYTRVKIDETTLDEIRTKIIDGTSKEKISEKIKKWGEKDVSTKLRRMLKIFQNNHGYIASDPHFGKQFETISNESRLILGPHLSHCDHDLFLFIQRKVCGLFIACLHFC